MLTKVAKLTEVPEGAGLAVEVGGVKIAVFNLSGKLAAVSDVCLHQGGPLGEGTLEGATVACPWHHWQYDVTTGACKTRPGLALKKFAVKVEGDDVLVDV